jgi:hypothetical protein
MFTTPFAFFSVHSPALNLPLAMFLVFGSAKLLGELFERLWTGSEVERVDARWPNRF